MQVAFYGIVAMFVFLFILVLISNKNLQKQIDLLKQLTILIDKNVSISYTEMSENNVQAHKRMEKIENFVKMEE